MFDASYGAGLIVVGLVLCSMGTILSIYLFTGITFVTILLASYVYMYNLLPWGNSINKIVAVIVAIALSWKLSKFIKKFS